MITTNRRHAHRGERVRAGPFTVLAGGTMYHPRPTDLDDWGNQCNTLVALGVRVPVGFEAFRVIEVPMQDFGGVPDEWEEFLTQDIIPMLESGTTLFAFCAGSHGRTGTFLASLIALLETAEETPDPIAAVRERHCSHAVETDAQAEAIFALRGQQVPDEYRGTLLPALRA